MVMKNPILGTGSYLEFRDELGVERLSLSSDIRAVFIL